VYRRYFWLERLTALVALCFVGFAVSAIWLYWQGKSVGLGASLAVAGVSAVLAATFFRVHRELRARNPDPRISRRRGR
jgi:membrane associated rhomboid family serine protease